MWRNTVNSTQDAVHIFRKNGTSALLIVRDGVSRELPDGEPPVELPPIKDPTPKPPPDDIPFSPDPVPSPPPKEIPTPKEPPEPPPSEAADHVV
jgi:hypothetical protein